MFTVKCYRKQIEVQEMLTIHARADCKSINMSCADLNYARMGLASIFRLKYQDLF